MCLVFPVPVVVVHHPPATNIFRLVTRYAVNSGMCICAKESPALTLFVFKTAEFSIAIAFLNRRPIMELFSNPGEIITNKHIWKVALFSNLCPIHSHKVYLSTPLERPTPPKACGSDVSLEGVIQNHSLTLYGSSTDQWTEDAHNVIRWLVPDIPADRRVCKLFGAMLHVSYRKRGLSNESSHSIIIQHGAISVNKEFVNVK